MSAEQPLLQARALVKRFALTRGTVLRRTTGAIHAVEGVSFSVRRGETLGLVGETGCGKSTTARLAARLIDPTAGEVYFEGENITHLSGRRLKPVRRELQMVFQDPFSSLNPHRRTGAIIAEPFAIHGLHGSRGERRRAVHELMAMVGLDAEHYNRYPHELSGGQRQRVGLARALALRPKLLIADEPVSALDVSIQAQVLNLLRDLQRQLSLTLVLISHDLAVVRHMCDRVAVMYLGRIVELGSAEAIYDAPRHPYTAALLAAVPAERPGAARRERLPLSGEPPDPANPPGGCPFHPRCPKARERCAAQEPPLARDATGAGVACHYPLTPAEADRLRGHTVRSAA
jgi:peptide/nickel transport system ATP-binding protein